MPTTDQLVEKWGNNTNLHRESPDSTASLIQSSTFRKDSLNYIAKSNGYEN